MKPLSRLGLGIVRGCGAMLAPGGPRGSLLVLIYHRVLPSPDAMLPSEPDASVFAAQMDLVSAICNVLPLGEAVERLVAGSLPPGAASITFDDGYANNLTIAAPILRERRLPATVFVATGFIGDGRMWNDTVIESVRHAPSVLDLSDLGLGRHELADFESRRRAVDSILGALKYVDQRQRVDTASAVAERVGVDLPSNLMMAERQIRDLQSFGIDVGAHTVSHPILTSLEPGAARHEIEESKRVLEAITARPVESFAYPNGRPGRDYQAVHVDMARKAGFKAAVSTAWGAARRTSDRLQIPRMLPWDRSALRFALRLLRTHHARDAEVAA